MARTSRKQKKSAEQKKESVMKIALYVRLSNEDNGGKSVDGIDNQIELLCDFIRQFENVEALKDTLMPFGKKEETLKDTLMPFGKKVENKIYIDNGQTGTDFERPGWERMIEDVKKGRIHCIIVKDLSRFARNYLEAGDYLEKIFPFLGVRFIAVNDRFDSAGEIFPQKELITEFKNLANDYYSKDISKKVMTAFRAKKQQGQFIGSKAPYGYILENNRYVIDESAATVVKRIFEMKMQGMSAYKIANILNQEGISSPSRYAGEQGMKKYKDCSHILWQQEAVSRILYNRAYVGDLVQGKYNHSIYSKEKRGKRKEDAWEIIEGIHPAIIDRETFLKVQEIKERNRKVWKDRQGGAGYENVLEGILVCGICHHAMWRNKDVRNGRARYYFFCGSAYGHSQVTCNTSSIVDYKIFNMVLRQIKIQIDLAIEVSSLLEQLKKSDCHLAVHRQKKKEAEQIRDELRRYAYLKTSIYEDMKQGILTKDEYFTAKERYVGKISELETEWNHKQAELNHFEQCMSSENHWLKAFLKFRDAEELTREMAVSLLEKVEIYEDKRIHIKFRFRNEYESFISMMQSDSEVMGGR
ncbi:recombinase family protein [Lachnospiraceae bacterium 45-W7]